MSTEIKKKTEILDKKHWKNAKRIWNTLSIQLGNKSTNQVDKGLTAQMESKVKL